MGLEEFEDDAKKKADPYRSSKLAPKSEDLEMVARMRSTAVDGIAHREMSHPYDVMKDVKNPDDPDYYFEVTHFPADQMFLSRMVKGILPVSDIVYVTDKKKFFSYELPLNRAEGADTDFNIAYAEAKADMLLFDYVFHCKDHGIEPNSHHNSRWVAGKIALYDFEFFATDFWIDKAYGGSGSNELVASIFRQRLQDLQKRLDGAQGLTFIRAILRNMEQIGAGVPAVIANARGKDKARSFHRELLRRITSILHSD